MKNKRGLELVIRELVISCSSGYKTSSEKLTQEILLKIRYFERGLSKSLRKLTFEPSPF